MDNKKNIFLGIAVLFLVTFMAINFWPSGDSTKADGEPDSANSIAVDDGLDSNTYIDTTLLVDTDFDITMPDPEDLMPDESDPEYIEETGEEDSSLADNSSNISTYKTPTKDNSSNISTYKTPSKDNSSNSSTYKTPSKDNSSNSSTYKTPSKDNSSNTSIYKTPIKDNSSNSSTYKTPAKDNSSNISTYKTPTNNNKPISNAITEELLIADTKPKPRQPTPPNSSAAKKQLVHKATLLYEQAASVKLDKIMGNLQKAERDMESFEQSTQSKMGKAKTKADELKQKNCGEASNAQSKYQQIAKNTEIVNKEKNVSTPVLIKMKGHIGSAQSEAAKIERGLQTVKNSNASEGEKTLREMEVALKSFKSQLDAGKKGVSAINKSVETAKAANNSVDNLTNSLLAMNCSPYKEPRPNDAEATAWLQGKLNALSKDKRNSKIKEEIKQKFGDLNSVNISAGNESYSIMQYIKKITLTGPYDILITDMNLTLNSETGKWVYQKVNIMDTKLNE